MMKFIRFAKVLMDEDRDKVRLRFRLEHVSEILVTDGNEINDETRLKADR